MFLYYYYQSLIFYFIKNILVCATINKGHLSQKVINKYKITKIYQKIQNELKCIIFSFFKKLSAYFKNREKQNVIRTSLKRRNVIYSKF